VRLVDRSWYDHEMQVNTNYCSRIRRKQAQRDRVEQERVAAKEKLVSEIRARQVAWHRTLTEELQMKRIFGLHLPTDGASDGGRMGVGAPKTEADVKRAVAVADAKQVALLTEIDQALAGYPTDSTYGRRKKILDATTLAGVIADSLEWRLIVRFGHVPTADQISEELGSPEKLHRAGGLLYQPPAEGPATPVKTGRQASPVQSSGRRRLSVSVSTEDVDPAALVAGELYDELMEAAFETLAPTAEAESATIVAEINDLAERQNRLRLGHLNKNWFTVELAKKRSGRYRSFVEWLVQGENWRKFDTDKNYTLELSELAEAAEFYYTHVVDDEAVVAPGGRDRGGASPTRIGNSRTQYTRFCQPASSVSVPSRQNIHSQGKFVTNICRPNVRVKLLGRTNARQLPPGQGGLSASFR
jgi:hypothetical protein